MKVLWLFVVFYFMITILFAEELGNPYKILGVSKNARIQDIRKVYKNLAKEWHPDKSNDPEAQNKFVMIKQAYELLSDPERRSMYDRRGITDDTYKERFDYFRYYTNPLVDLFNHAYSSYQESDTSFYNFIKNSL